MILSKIEQSKFGSWEELWNYVQGNDKDKVSLIFARVEGNDNENNNEKEQKKDEVH